MKSISSSSLFSDLTTLRINLASNRICVRQLCAISQCVWATDWKYFGHEHDHEIFLACAGKTLRSEWRKWSRKNHPRVREENSNFSPKTSGAVGSPPRARGKPCCSVRLIACDRITPACAGKTCAGGRFDRVPGDHPRVCGENKAAICSLRSGAGSPPRARGKLKLVIVDNDFDRITPACAGKTLAAG